MGKFEVYEALEAHGGEADAGQIKKWLADRYPNYSYSATYTHAMSRLMNQGCVKLVDARKRIYRIVGPFGERNVVLG